jgi:hypothetical protein
MIPSDGDVHRHRPRGVVPLPVAADVLARMHNNCTSKPGLLAPIEPFLK